MLDGVVYFLENNTGDLWKYDLANDTTTGNDSNELVETSDDFKADVGKEKDTKKKKEAPKTERTPQEKELVNFILFHCYATKKDGDDGARYILLRKKDKVNHG